MHTVYAHAYSTVSNDTHWTTAAAAALLLDQPKPKEGQYKGTRAHQLHTLPFCTVQNVKHVCLTVLIDAQRI